MKNKFDIQGRVAIVTGGNGLLGSEYVTALLHAGAKVAIFDIGDTSKKVKKLQERGKHVSVFHVDITKRRSIKNALKKIIEQQGAPHILINNAACDFPPGAGAEENSSFENYSLKSWKKALDVNLTGMMLCSQIIGGAMAKERRGNIVNITSTYGIVSPNQNIYAYRKKETGVPFIKPISYTVTKAGVIGMTKWLATYYAPYGVRVNALAPGGVSNNQDETFVRNYEQMTPLGRMARPDDYNEAILFLCSDASSYMTGSTLVVDGGWTAW